MKYLFIAIFNWNINCTELEQMEAINCLGNFERFEGEFIVFHFLSEFNCQILIAVLKTLNNPPHKFKPTISGLIIHE